MRTVAIPRGWGFDSNTKQTQASARAMLLAPFPGSPRVVLSRYLSIGNPSPADLTSEELTAIFAAGWPAVMPVQHVEWPNWQANSVVGTQHGAAAKRHADMLGIPDDAHLVLDVEGLGNAGAAAFDYVAYWSDAVRPHPTIVYDGYDDGLAPQWKLQLVARACVAWNAWWSDFGPRTLPPGLAYAVKQHVQIMLAGEQADPDEVLLDGVVMGFGPDPATVSTQPPAA